MCSLVCWCVICGSCTSHWALERSDCCVHKCFLDLFPTYWSILGPEHHLVFFHLQNFSVVYPSFFLSVQLALDHAYQIYVFLYPKYENHDNQG